jgi:nicotinamidase/pyrazinamidase
VIPNRECPLAIEGAQQIVVEKQTIDVFDVPNFSRILRLLAPDYLVVYGVVTEICVLHAVRGLHKAGHRVTVITDAIETMDPMGSFIALDEMQSAGASLALLQHVVEQ